MTHLVPTDAGGLHGLRGGGATYVALSRRLHDPMCKDKWGLSWQITPRVLTEALAKGGDVAKCAFEAMMDMRKIDVATIKAAVHDETV